MEQAWSWVVGALNAVIDEPRLLLIPAGIAVIFILIRFVLYLLRYTKHGIWGRPSHFDAERLFTISQKRRGHQRADYRCEFEDRFWRRCRNESTHADHYFPYARGGATTMRNFVAACDQHNISKGSRMPTPAQRRRLQIRRRTYFPNDELVWVGEWTSKRTRRIRKQAEHMYSA